MTEAEDQSQETNVMTQSLTATSIENVMTDAADQVNGTTPIINGTTSVDIKCVSYNCKGFKQNNAY